VRFSIDWSLRVKIRRSAGFTLLELLVSIAIIGALVAIILPSLSSARRSAKANVCLSHLSQIGKLSVLYLQVNKDEFPPFRLKKVYPTATEEFVNGFKRRSPRWQWFLAGEDEPVIEPDNSIRILITRHGSWGDEPGGFLARRMTVETFQCPMLTDPELELDVRNGAYGYNYQYLGNSRTDTDASRWDNFPVRLHKIKNPGKTVLVADSRGAGRNHGLHSYALDPPRLAVERNAKRFGPELADVERGLDPTVFQYSPVEMRHNGRGNVLFVDTHAEAMTHKQLGYQPKQEAADPRDNGQPVPILDPGNTTYTATNQMWNGKGRDEIAEEHAPVETGGDSGN
jgi:prepilin-type N-terminal cleavage/methylation domain-containing protein/prepilin-type processing-associated H-X9-DG protein